uniref:FBA_2 domain-containing protein n=1 Tax=Panagrellus redivivus TaxID=6233 RepID=A0A7E4VJD8_PANRE
MFLCLTRLKKRINSANSRLQRIIDQIQVICNIQQLFELRTELLRGPNMGLCLKIIAIDVMGQIDVFLDKFKGIEPLPFNDLPYECQNRLVALFPPPDLVSFKLAGKTATKYANKRGMFSACLSIIRNSIHYENTRNTYGKNKYYDISSTNLFLNLSSCYVQTGLYLNLDSTEKFDRTIELVRSCDYTCLTLQGPYTYKHAIYLMRVSKNVQHVCLSIGIQIEIEDYEDYYEAIVQWLNSHGDAIMYVNCFYCDSKPLYFIFQDYYLLQEFRCYISGSIGGTY